MRTKAKIIFLGGKPLGYDVLSFLAEREEVLAIFTNEEDSHPTWYTSVETIARKYKISYFTTNINEQGELISAFRPDFIICHGYDTIVRDEILAIPGVASINIHTGLSEEYRGRYPTVFPILDNRTTAGTTIHKMTSNVDGGDIYAQAFVTIDPTDTAESLYYKCAGAGASLFKHIWFDIKQEKIKPRRQLPTKKLKVITKSDFPELEMSLRWSEAVLDRKIRALTFRPFQKPFFVIKGKKYEIDYMKKK